MSEADAPLLALLDALADGETHSGERLAEHFGLTRAGLAKRIDRLREWGVTVQAQAGIGYRLAAPLERLDADAIRSALAARAPGLQVAVGVRVDSTNSRLLEADSAHDPQALVVESQTAGRGRRGRQWLSPFGANLYCSMAYSFESWPARLTTLPLAVAVAVARVLAEQGLSDVAIKWPNDLYADGVKLGGILIEPRGETGGACRVVVGIGLNVAMREEQAAGVEQAWTSLAQALRARGKPTPSRNALAVALLAELHQSLAHFAQYGFAPFAHEWRLLDWLAGRVVATTGAEALEGVAQGIDDDGGLLIDTAAGRRSVHAGEVSVRPQA